MLSELRIRDFAIIDDLHLHFNEGFNVLTGETGAGKSIILDSVMLLLGGRADEHVVRSSAKVAQVEAVFQLDGRTATRLKPLLESEGLEGEAPDMLVLAREVRKGGRNLCRINGRTVTLGMLKEVGTGLVDIHGQSEHLSLLKSESHVGLLDSYAGLESQRMAFGEVVRQFMAVNNEYQTLLRDAEEQDRRAEMLAYEVEEISVANFEPGEEEALNDERIRLANAEQLATLSDEAYLPLYEEGADGQRPASDLLAEVTVALAKLAKIDDGLQQYYDIAEELSAQAEELARSLQDYREGIEYNPTRLREVEERLQLIVMLQRKYACESVAELLTHAQAAAAELETLEGRDEHIRELQVQIEALLPQIGREGASLSSARVAASDKLAQAIEAELAELKMEDARFGVSIEQVDDENGVQVGDYKVAFDVMGIDRVEFMIAPNIGEPLKPIARIASGGETSRLMLALKTVLSRADHTPTLIFDEIDAGIGGRIGAMVGSKLWGLADAHQVMVVTHLPQLAGFGDAHFKVQKEVVKNRTVTRVTVLDDAGRVDELADMLGAETEASRKGAQELIAYVREVKKSVILAAVGS